MPTLEPPLDLAKALWDCPIYLDNNDRSIDNIITWLKAIQFDIGEITNCCSQLYAVLAIVAVSALTRPPTLFMAYTMKYLYGRLDKKLRTYGGLASQRPSALQQNALSAQIHYFTSGD